MCVVTSGECATRSNCSNASPFPRVLKARDEIGPYLHVRASRQSSTRPALQVRREVSWMRERAHWVL